MQGWIGKPLAGKVARKSTYAYVLVCFGLAVVDTHLQAFAMMGEMSTPPPTPTRLPNTPARPPTATASL